MWAGVSVRTSGLPGRAGTGRPGSDGRVGPGAGSGRRDAGAARGRGGREAAPPRRELSVTLAKSLHPPEPAPPSVTCESQALVTSWGGFEARWLDPRRVPGAEGGSPGTTPASVRERGLSRIALLQILGRSSHLYIFKTPEHYEVVAKLLFNTNETSGASVRPTLSSCSWDAHATAGDGYGKLSKWCAAVETLSFRIISICNSSCLPKPVPPT